MNFFVVALGLIAVAIPAAPVWEGEEHFDFVFGMPPRIVAASLMAFLVGSFINASVMSKMKVASQGRNFSARAISVSYTHLIVRNRIVNLFIIIMCLFGNLKTFAPTGDADKTTSCIDVYKRQI